MRHCAAAGRLDAALQPAEFKLAPTAPLLLLRLTATYPVCLHAPNSAAAGRTTLPRLLAAESRRIAGARATRGVSGRKLQEAFLKGARGNASSVSLKGRFRPLPREAHLFDSLSPSHSQREAEGGR